MNHQLKIKKTRQIIDKSPQITPQKKTDNDSDSDNFDPIDEEEIVLYNKLGEIKPSIKRMVLKGSGKSYYG